MLAPLFLLSSHRASQVDREFGYPDHSSTASAQGPPDSWVGVGPRGCSKLPRVLEKAEQPEPGGRRVNIGPAAFQLRISARDNNNSRHLCQALCHLNLAPVLRQTRKVNLGDAHATRKWRS